MNPIVLMIDEVDSASNHQVFLDFLALLRGYYLEREDKATFHSVILAGVYDIKNLKLKMRPEKEYKYNSPWNQTAQAPFDIAAVFNLDMSFSADEIGCMLREYEADYQTGMDVEEISECIYEYTSGYPYLVSALCKLIDENICGREQFAGMAEGWTRAGVLEAVKIMLERRAPLFESMIRQLSDYPELKQMLQVVLFQGKRVTFNLDNAVINLASMFGYIGNEQGSVQVANRIFEMRLYNFFLSEEDEYNERGEEQLAGYLDYFHQEKGYMLSFNFT